jgi:hypothetical protein
VAFTDEPARAVLEWEGTGLVVSCTTSTLAARIAVERFEQRVAAGKPIRDKDIGRLAAVFVQHVAYWNIKRESGALVPTTRKGVLSLDRWDTLLPMLRQWMAIVARPPASGGDGESGDAQAAPETVTAGEDPDEAILAAMEARSLTEPGDGEQLVTDSAAVVDEEPAPVLEPV